MNVTQTIVSIVRPEPASDPDSLLCPLPFAGATDHISLLIKPMCAVFPGKPFVSVTVLLFFSLLGCDVFLFQSVTVAIYVYPIP